MKCFSQSRSTSRLLRSIHWIRLSQHPAGYALLIAFLLPVVAPSFSAISARPLRDTVLSYRSINSPVLNELQDDFRSRSQQEMNYPAAILEEGRAGTTPGQSIVGGSPFDFHTRGAFLGKHRAQATHGVSTVMSQKFVLVGLYKWRFIELISLLFIESAFIAGLFWFVLRQRHHVRQLAYRRNLEVLIAQSAAEFVDFPQEKIDTVIENSFRRVLEFFGLDRCDLLEFLEGKAQHRILCTRGTAGAGKSSGIVDLGQQPWTSVQIPQAKDILVARLDDLPAAYVTLGNCLRRSGIRSFAGFPLMRDQSPFGMLSFSTVGRECTWEPDACLTLRTIADMFGSALERKQAEETKCESQSRLTGIVESAMDAILAVDDDQRIVVFNPTAEKMFACAAHEAIGYSIEKFIPHRFRSRHVEHIINFAGSTPANHAMGRRSTLTALRSNGEEFPIETSISRVKVGDRNLFTAIIRDVTERAQAEQQLRDSHELNLSILQSLRIQLAVLDSKGTIVAATAQNPDVVAVSGIRLLDLSVGVNYLEACKAAAEAGDGKVAAALEGIRDVNDAKREFFQFEYNYRSENRERWFLMSVTPMKSPGRGVVITHEETTQRKGHERAIQELSWRLISAQEQERERIARELHDDLNQKVAIIAIELQRLGSLFPENADEEKGKVNDLWNKVHSLSMDVQRLSHQLHSTKLHYLGIVAALRGLCNEISEHHKIEIDFQSRQVPPVIDSGTSLSLFRIAQEGLHNVAKHARAQKAKVELFGTGDTVVLRVSDNGIGFDPDAPQHKTGLGMISMEERIRAVGGALSVCSKPSLGTEIEATVPISRSTLAAVVPTHTITYDAA
jgi:PAS domain S-box-containing protein